MSTIPKNYEDIVSTIRSWPPAQQQRLAESILGSLKQEEKANLPRGVPVDRVRGIAAGNGPPPDDETVRRWIDEHRLEK